MGHRLAGVWNEAPGDFQLCGLWYPEGDEVTKYLIARLESESFYRADKLLDALGHVRRFRGTIDCGAWVGAWSRELGRRFNRVVAIEMHPGNARCAAKNCADVRNVTVLNYAAGDRNATMSAKRTRFGGTIESWVGQADASIETSGEHALPVKMRRIDDIPEVQSLGPVDYLKVHVNGAELNALRGAERTIRTHRPVITVVIKRALVDFGHTPEDVFAYMTRIGYDVAGRSKPYWTFVPR